MADLTDSELSTLASEITGDPDGLGYADPLASSDFNALRDLLNERRAAYTVRRTSIPMSEVYAQVDWVGEWTGLSGVQREGFRQMTSTPNLDASSEQIVSAFEAIFGTGSTTWANLAGIVDRQASRAEDLFGAGANITTANIQDALS